MELANEKIGHGQTSDSLSLFTFFTGLIKLWNNNTKMIDWYLPKITSIMHKCMCNR